MKRMVNGILTRVYKHSAWATFAWVLLSSTSALAQERNDSIDHSQFVVAYDFVTNTTDGVGNAVKDSV
ncbi:MAG: hypothetical protein K2J84_03690, partial [Bacteroidaceae bacterium]|nr:hypothetical protein [Bacteroidaceae bacterium]